MKDKVRPLTIISGIMTILLGIFACVISVFLLLGAVSETDPLLFLVTFGMLVILHIFLFILALTLGIITIIIGVSTIRLGSCSYYDYSVRKGRFITYCCFDVIILITSAVFAIIFPTTPLIISCCLIGGVVLISFIFKIVDNTMFKKKVNRGLISVEKPKVELPKINLDNLNLNKGLNNTNKVQTLNDELNKLNNLKKKKLISEEEYQELRKKLLDEIGSKSDSSDGANNSEKFGKSDNSNKADSSDK